MMRFIIYLKMKSNKKDKDGMRKAFVQGKRI